MADFMVPQLGAVEYRIIPLFPAYRVGSDGSVWSCWERGGRGRRIGNTWRRKTPDVMHAGHLRVQVYNQAGQCKRFYVHLLVLELFVGPRPDGCEGCHGDGDPSNNSLSNLRWDTPQGNWRDRRAHGRGCEGEKNASAKLTEAQARAVKARRLSGETTTALGREFGVTPQAVHLIATGKKWGQL